MFILSVNGYVLCHYGMLNGTKWDDLRTDMRHLTFQLGSSEFIVIL